ncbi:MAG: DUF368 domain-containing protein [Clostridia bacterium]|jgi:putative membrane protein|nr:DUF368 domain-containing protein [Clostridia bacterium]MBQ5833458.1 DUF368 domain-containing protein [Clostridia bacterium]
MEKQARHQALRWLLWVLQGLIVGIGAILPGVSGGTLCYVFGIYTPLLEVLSSPIKGIRKHWLLLIFVGLGGAIGFVGFSGITAALLAWNEPVVLCVFIGLILGTLPDIWRESGEQGRGKGAIAALVISFACIAALFYLFGSVWTVTIPETLWGFAICGVIWGLSFIVPGFSSSTLLLFFGIYEAMSQGISRLQFSVILPLGATMLLTLLLLSRVMRTVFERYHAIASHVLLGFVMATTLMMLLKDCILSTLTPVNVLIYLLCILCGAGAGFGFTYLCDSLRKKAEKE